MENMRIAECIAKGKVIYLDRDEEAGNIEWTKHPKFKGVFLKHLIKGADTNGKLSCHLVKVDAGCILEEHIHENQWELHEVIEGKGDGVLETKEVSYQPGYMAVIPCGTRHKVTAGNEGLVLLAKFFPVLL